MGSILTNIAMLNIFIVLLLGNFAATIPVPFGTTSAAFRPVLGDARRYECHHWTPEEQNKILIGGWNREKERLGKGKEKTVCESRGPGYKFTGGDNTEAPGCGNCWCCLAVPFGTTSAVSVGQSVLVDAHRYKCHHWTP